MHNKAVAIDFSLIDYRSSTLTITPRTLVVSSAIPLWHRRDPAGACKPRSMFKR